ncbi:hypothetical protein [Kozakia baliensis]|uniref:Uncharacterized protein n=1 Tax=Kozakia baliensis TaxID=153496 RepID=A0A1D8URH3_9PROT|nr:hypothetical protein [Kozakia baliensis]AOX16234.1 hypothetical protein A0U89_02870 [Kozakia baliensis]GBR28309.1 hypothetical protein AA0488_1379 [Kozakia baliensis NRIC 0488]GEL63720.1 hypothetical protein KBA01_10060 [Kozakia baliensis]
MKIPTLYATALTVALAGFVPVCALADPAHDVAASSTKELTPVEKVALPDGGAPSPPHGYTATEDFDASLANYSSTVRTHQALGLPNGEAHQSTSIPNDAPSHFSFLGMPVKFNAPVRPPYANSAYHSYAGSPGNGQTDVVSQSDAASTAKWDNNEH